MRLGLKITTLACSFVLMLLTFSDYAHANSRQIQLQDSFNQANNWMLYSGPNTSATTNTNYTKDTASIQLSATDTAAFIRNTNTSLNLNQYTGGEFSIYVENSKNIEYVSVYFATDSSFSGGYGYIYFDVDSLSDGWNTLSFGFNQIVSINGFEPTSTINTLQVRMQPMSGKTATIYCDDLTMIKANQGDVLFIMDDGWNTQYTTGYTLLNKYNMKGNVAVVSSLVNTRNYVSTKQLKNMYNSGWNLLNHTATHMDLSAFSLYEQRNEITNGTNWLNKNGFSRTSTYVVYPYGKFNNDTFTVLKEMNSPFGRSIVSGIETSPPTSKYLVRSIMLTPSVTAEQAKAYVDAAVATGNSVIFLLHRFGNINDPMYYSPANFEKLLIHVSSLRNSKQVEVLTVSEWLN